MIDVMLIIKTIKIIDENLNFTSRLAGHLLQSFIEERTLDVKTTFRIQMSKIALSLPKHATMNNVSKKKNLSTV